MTEINADVFLEHYGVKGMKWGVRKQGTQSSTSTRVGRAARKLSGGGGPGITDPTPRSKARAKYRSDKAKAKAAVIPARKAASRMKGGEIAISFLLAGPVGVGAYKAIKVARARADNPAVALDDD